MIPASGIQRDRWEERASATDWDSVRADLEAYGCGLTGPLLTPEETGPARCACPAPTQHGKPDDHDDNPCFGTSHARFLAQASRMNLRVRQGRPEPRA